MQQATNEIANIDPIKFFNEGKIVYIDLVFNDISNDNKKEIRESLRTCLQSFD